MTCRDAIFCVSTYHLVTRFLSAMSMNPRIPKPAIQVRRWADIVVLLILLGTALVPAMLLYAQPRDTTIRMDTPPALLPRDGLYRYERWPGENAGVYSW